MSSISSSRSPAAYSHKPLIPAPSQEAPGPELAAMSGKKRIKSIDGSHINQLLTQLAPMVQKRSGFAIDLARVHVAVLAPSELASALLEEHKVRAHDVNAHFNTKEKILVEGSFLAAYLSSTRTIAVAKTHANRMSWDKLRSCLFHELVHVGQHQAHPNYFAELDTLVTQCVQQEAKDGKKAASSKATQKRIGARMTLLEGQAIYLQRKAAAQFPQQRSFGDWRAFFSGFVALATGQGRGKMLQYARGCGVFEDIEKGKISRSFPERAFKDPRLADRWLDSIWHTVDLRNSDDGRPTMGEVLGSGFWEVRS